MHSDPSGSHWCPRPTRFGGDWSGRSFSSARSANTSSVSSTTEHPLRLFYSHSWHGTHQPLLDHHNVSRGLSDLLRSEYNHYTTSPLEDSSVSTATPPLSHQLSHRPINPTLRAHVARLAHSTSEAHITSLPSLATRNWSREEATDDAPSGSAADSGSEDSTGSSLLAIEDTRRSSEPGTGLEADTHSASDDGATTSAGLSDNASSLVEAHTSGSVSTSATTTLGSETLDTCSDPPVPTQLSESQLSLKDADTGLRTSVKAAISQDASPLRRNWPWTELSCSQATPSNDLARQRPWAPLSSREMVQAPRPFISSGIYEPGMTRRVRPRTNSYSASISRSDSQIAYDGGIDSQHDGTVNLPSSPVHLGKRRRGTCRSMSCPPVPGDECFPSHSPPPSPPPLPHVHLPSKAESTDQSPPSNSDFASALASSPNQVLSSSGGADLDTGTGSETDWRHHGKQTKGLPQDGVTEVEIPFDPASVAPENCHSTPDDVLGLDPSAELPEELMDSASAAQLAFAYHPHDMWIPPHPYLQSQDHSRYTIAVHSSEEEKTDEADKSSFGLPKLLPEQTPAKAPAELHSAAQHGLALLPDETQWASPTDAALWYGVDAREAQFELRLDPLWPPAAPTAAQWVVQDAIRQGHLHINFGQDPAHNRGLEQVQEQSLDQAQGQDQELFHDTDCTCPSASAPFRGEPCQKRFFVIWPECAPVASFPEHEMMPPEQAFWLNRLLPSVANLEPEWTEWNWSSSC